MIIKLAYGYGVDSVTLMTLRMLYALPFYLIPLWFWLGRNPEARPEGRILWQGLLVGVSGYYLAALFDLMALQYITAQLERLVLFIYPTLVVLGGVVFLRKPLLKGVIPALLLSYFGVAAIFIHDLSTQGDQVVMGALLAFAAAISFAFFLMASRPLVMKLGSARFTSLAMTASSCAILLHFFCS